MLQHCRHNPFQPAIPVPAFLNGAELKALLTEKKPPKYRNKWKNNSPPHHHHIVYNSVSYTGSPQDWTQKNLFCLCSNTLTLISILPVDIKKKKTKKNKTKQNKTKKKIKKRHTCKQHCSVHITNGTLKQAKLQDMP